MLFIEDLHELFLKHPLVTTDTRNIMPGSLFFALKGEHFNGNAFAAEALSKGASYVVIDEKEHFIDDRTILTEDVLKTLQALASYHRQQLNPIVIAITGSNGKTTTKELMQRVLSTQFETLATEGNFNNHIGVPLTLLRLEPKHTHAIIEMGANHRFEIEQLCAIALPNFGFITNIGKAHLEGFGGEEGVARGKTELYYYLFKTNGIAFVNADDEKTMYHSKNNPRVLFSGEGEGAIARLISVNPQIIFEIDGNNYESALSGLYNFQNILSALAVGKYFGIDSVKCGLAIATYIPQNMRHQWIEWQGNKVLLDAYNANPDSMHEAIHNFAQLDSMHKIVVLGDMFELGSESKDEHQIIINSFDDCHFEEVLVCGAHFAEATALNDVKIFPSFDALQTYFNSRNFKDKTILIKGSRSMKMERLIGK